MLLAVSIGIAGYAGNVLEALKTFSSIDKTHDDAFTPSKRKSRFAKETMSHSSWSESASRRDTTSKHLGGVPLVSNFLRARHIEWTQHEEDRFDLTSLHEQGPLTTTTSRKLQPLISLQTACSFMKGSFDQTGKCIVCSGDNCFALGDDLVARSENFCTATAFPSSVEVTYCGKAKCILEGLTIQCESSIPILDHILKFSATCTIELSCVCNGVTWDEEPCSSCEGAGDGYDCQNVLGPLKLYAKPLDPVRSYRNNLFFSMAVNSKTLPEASKAAGIPIGGAVHQTRWPYRDQFFPRHYTSLTPSNWMKWPALLQDRSVLGVYNFTVADEVVDFAVSSGIQLRGHCLIWPVRAGDEYRYPTVVTMQVNASTDPVTTLTGIMREHIHAVAQHFGDKVGVWDVVNEHLLARTEDSIFYKILGDEYVRLAFELTRQVLPNTPLVWNEAVYEYSLSDPSIKVWLELLQTYKNEGVPVDRVGVQGHTITLHNLTALRIFLRTVADMGYDVEVTEFDAPIGLFRGKGEFLHDPYQAQADYAAEYLRACLDSGRCKGFTTWGLSDNYTWLDEILSPSAPNRPLLIDEEGYPKPAWLSVRNELESFANTGSIFNWFLGIFASLWSKLVILASLGLSLITG